MARSLIVEAASANGTFSSNEAFLDFFKGLHIKTNNNSQLPNEGAALYLDINDPSSKATIYFKQNGEATSYDLLMNSDCADYNHEELDASNTSMDEVYKYQPGNNLSDATRIESSSTQLANIGVIGVYNSLDKNFNINIRDYVQSIVNKELTLTELVVSPLFFINSAERIIFNGSNTINKMKPKLTITYTSY